MTGLQFFENMVEQSSDVVVAGYFVVTDGARVLMSASGRGANPHRHAPVPAAAVTRCFAPNSFIRQGAVDQRYFGYTFVVSWFESNRPRFMIFTWGRARLSPVAPAG